MLFLFCFKFSKFIPYQYCIFLMSQFHSAFPFWSPFWLLLFLKKETINSQTAHLRPVLFKQTCFNLKPQEYTDNNLFVNSVFNFIIRHCQAMFLFKSVIKKSMTNSKLNATFCSSIVNACHSLFVWSYEMAKISLVEVVFHCIIFPTLWRWSWKYDIGNLV